MGATFGNGAVAAAAADKATAALSFDCCALVDALAEGAKPDEDGGKVEEVEMEEEEEEEDGAEADRDDTGEAAGLADAGLAAAGASAETTGDAARGVLFLITAFSGTCPGPAASGAPCESDFVGRFRAASMR